MQRGASPPRSLLPPTTQTRRHRLAALRVSALACAIAVSACTTLRPSTSQTPDALSGRLALRVDALGNEPPRAFSAAFDLRGRPDAGTLALSTPLGSMLAEARWSPAEVVLATPQGTRRFTSLQALTQEALGESIPLEAWFDWLRGRPWPGAPSETLPAVRDGFAQLGWRVDLGGFAEGTVQATRESPPPTVSVRIRLDRT
jgi:outer membrane lipoprotein LolB